MSGLLARARADIKDAIGLYEELESDILKYLEKNAAKESKPIPSQHDVDLDL